MQQTRRRKKKKKLKYKRLYTLILIIIITVLCVKFISGKNKETESVSKSSSTQNSVNNEVIPEEIVPVSTIKGQTLVNDADGYVTKFTTSNENTRTYIEYKQILGSWSEKSYWGGTMAENGCGITSMAIIASGYGLDITPEYFRDKYFPHLDAENMISAFENIGLKCSDFYFSSTQISKRYMGGWLREGNPVLICVNSTRENMWTAASHYMVILDIDKDGNFYISNPNGEEGSERASGWYTAAEIIPFIAKVAFIEPLTPTETE